MRAALKAGYGRGTPGGDRSRIRDSRNCQAQWVNAHMRHQAQPREPTECFEEGGPILRHRVCDAERRP